MESNTVRNLEEEEVRKLVRKHHFQTSFFFSSAAIMLVLSIFMPYWELSLEAPQYPDGLHVSLYVNHVAGDVAEIDGLNHYIGMRPLNEAAVLERTMSVLAIISFSLLAAAAILVHNRWAALLSLPVMLYPVAFVADLYFWLRLFGQNLDPKAPLSSSVEPFTQPLFGTKEIANFITSANFGYGFYISCIAVIFTAIGLYLHRRRYRPPLQATRDGTYLQRTMMSYGQTSDDK